MSCDIRTMLDHQYELKTAVINARFREREVIVDYLKFKGVDPGVVERIRMGSHWAHRDMAAWEAEHRDEVAETIAPNTAEVDAL